MTDHRTPDFERLPGDGPLDETDVNLRAYFARLTDSTSPSTTRRGPMSASWSGTGTSGPTAD